MRKINRKFMPLAKKERNAEVIAACKEGKLSKVKIAEIHGISPVRVGQIYKQYLFKQSLRDENE